MYLDPRTLTVTVIVACMLLGPVSLAFGFRHKGLRAATYWGSALLLLAAGLGCQALQASFPGGLPPAVVFAFLLGAALCIEQCARALRDQPAPDVAGTATGLALLASMLVWSGPAYEQVMAYTGSGLLAILVFRAARAFERDATARDAGAARLAATIAGLAGVGLLFDAAGTALSLRHTDPMLSAVIDSVLMVGLMVGVVGATLSLMWMLTGRLSDTLRRLATRDPLTGTLNRAAFMRAHARELARAGRRSDSHYALVLLDIDHLGKVNGAFGHAAGDRVMRALVASLRGQLREYDVLGRIDGDEFAMLLPGTLADGAMNTAERVRQNVERSCGAACGFDFPVTISAGIAVHGVDGETWDALMSAAQAALCTAKRGGRNRSRLVSAAHSVASGLAAPGRVAVIEPKDPFAALGELVDAPRPVGG